MSHVSRTYSIVAGVGALSVGAVVALGASPFRDEDAAGAISRPDQSTSHAGSQHATRAGIDLSVARRATAPFRSVDRASRAGYALPPEGPLHQCVTDYKNTGAMGFHFINETNAGDTVLDPAKPEALVYHRDGKGRVRLGALEYVVGAEAWDSEHSEPPEILGQPMMLVTAPNRYDLPAFYMLHAWVWKANPRGVFSPYNPRVSCHCDEPPATSARDDSAKDDAAPHARGDHGAL